MLAQKSHIQRGKIERESKFKDLTNQTQVVTKRDVSQYIRKILRKFGQEMSTSLVRDKE